MNATNLKVAVSILSNKGHIDVTWNETDRHPKFLRFDLVRKKASIPAHYFDGKLVYSGTENTFSDTNIKNGTIYYYRLFVVVNDGENYNTDYLTDSRCIVKAMAFASNIVSYGDRLYKTLPDQVLADDLKLNQNLPLKRFFQLLFTEFDKLEVFNNKILDQLDIETCDESILPLHARWIGLEYDQNFGVEINRLLLSTWKEIQPYQGTETGVRYLLQKVFNSEVEITVTELVEITVIASDINNIGYWMINHIDKINKLIKRFLALRTKWDLTIRLGPIYEDFDHDRIEEWYFDTLWYLPEEEWYQPKDSCTCSEEFLLSHSLFFADCKGNRIKDDLFDILHMLPEYEVYSLDRPCLLSSSLHKLSESLYFAKRIRDCDELFDRIFTEYAERYTRLQKDEYAFDSISETFCEHYDKTSTTNHNCYLLSDSLCFASGAENPADDYEYIDNVTVTDEDEYNLAKPYLLSDGDSLLSSNLLFAVETRDRDVLFDNVIEAYEETDEHKREDETFDIITEYNSDIYDPCAMFCTGNLLSESLMFASSPKSTDEIEDKGITEDSEQYYIVMPALMFCAGLIGQEALGYSTVNPPDELHDNIVDVQTDEYDKSKVNDESYEYIQDVHIADIWHEQSGFCSGFFIGESFCFAKEIVQDELIDIPHYVRPVGLFASAEAFLGSSMFTCDNLI